jgi:hypothetical protein
VSIPFISTAGLKALLRDKNDLIGAEIGVHTGQSAEFMLRNLNLKKLYCVDPWLPYSGENSGAVFQTVPDAERSYSQAMNAIKPFTEKVEVLRMTSKEATDHVPNESLDFVFIDANHAYESVIEDLDLWYPKVKPLGLFSGHDWSSFGVRPALLEFFKHDLNSVKTGPNDIWYVEKVCAVEQW